MKMFPKCVSFLIFITRVRRGFMINFYRIVQSASAYRIITISNEISACVITEHILYTIQIYILYTYYTFEFIRKNLNQN